MAKRKQDFSAMSAEATAFQQMTVISGAADARGSADQEEQEERMNSLRTQGRKGCKCKRFNMNITPDNLDFIQVVARVQGLTMSEFANRIFDRFRAEHPDVYERAKAFKEETDGMGL